MRVLFLRADFPDAPASRPRHTLVNRTRDGLLDRFADYWAEVSRGRFRVETLLASRVYSVPRPRTQYVGHTGDLVRAALAAATAPAAPDRDPIRAFRPEAIVVLFAGPGAESDVRNEAGRLPWSEALTGPAFRAPGVEVTRVMVVAENPLSGLSPFGVLAHEFGHLLGLPELYAPGRAHEGVGIWDLMGQGTWLGGGDAPPHPGAWAKLRLGWADPVDVARDTAISLPSVERSGRVVRIAAHPDAPGEYFLVENRRRIGADRRLPGEGLLVWHVDESRDSFRRSQDDPAHKRVDLLTADSWPSHLDLGVTRGGNRGDAGDPWADRIAGPGPDTAPSTASHRGGRGRFALRDISPSAETMTFSVEFGDDAGAGAPAALSPPPDPPPAPRP